ncbi:DUF302 domain-containing protein [Paenibacillus marinisediminis]
MSFHYTVESKKSVEDAIRDIGINLRKHKFGILWQMNIPDKLQEKGVNTYKSPYRVLAVCNPQESANALNHNELAGYFMPTKITVYKSGTQTMIGLPRPSALVGMINDPELTQVAERIEQVLIEVIEQSK